MQRETIAARPDWVEALVDLQVATNFGGPSPAAAELVLATLNDGNHRKHLDGLRRRLARVRRETAANTGMPKSVVRSSAQSSR